MLQMHKVTPGKAICTVQWCQLIFCQAAKTSTTMSRARKNWVGRSNTSLLGKAQQSPHWDTCRCLSTTMLVALVGLCLWSWIHLMWPKMSPSPYHMAWFSAKSCLTPSPDSGVTLSCYLTGIYRVCPSKNLLRKGMLQSLSSRGISAYSMGTLGVHQHIPGTFSSEHPQERNKERTSIQPAWQNLYLSRLR